MTTTRKLYDIGADLMALDSLLDECGGDISDPVADAAITAWFAELTGERGAKLDNYINSIRKDEMESSAAFAESEQYKMLGQVKKNRAERKKVRLKEFMEGANELRMETASLRVITVQKNGGKIPVEIILDVEPEEVLGETPHLVRVQTVYAFDRDKIRDSLEAGENIVWATLRPRGTQLRIK